MAESKADEGRRLETDAELRARVYGIAGNVPQADRFVINTQSGHDLDVLASRYGLHRAGRDVDPPAADDATQDKGAGFAKPHEPSETTQVQDSELKRAHEPAHDQSANEPADPDPRDGKPADIKSGTVKRSG